MPQSYDVLIVGGGIVGAACAYELARARLRCAIVEEREIGGGATNAGMGHLVVLDDSEAQLALSRYSLELWRELGAELPAQCEYWQCGTLWIAADEEEVQLARRKRERYAGANLMAEILDARQLSELEPNLRTGLAGGLFIGGDAAVHPPSAAKFLVERSGAEVIAKRAVCVIGDSLQLGDGSTLRAQAIVNATGTAANHLTPGVPIRARKGHIVVAAPGPGFTHHQVVELGYVKSTHAEEGDSVTFNVRQNRNGELLIGSSRQYGARDSSIEPDMIERMLARAVEYMPALAHAPQLRSWTGFRAGTPDGLPLIGPCPGSENLYIATGHEGLGATTSLATARLIADQILGRVPEIDPTRFSPSRFPFETV